MNILLFFDNILFSKFKNDSSVFDFTNMRSLWQRDVLCKNTYAYCLGSRTISPVVVQMNDLANVFESFTRTWRDWCSRRCPSGNGPNRCCPCRCCPSRSYPSNCGEMLSQQVVLEDVLAAEDRLAEEAVGGLRAGDEQGLTMQLQMQMQKLMKVAKLTNQILMLKPIRRTGGSEVAMPCVLAGAVAFCKLGGTSWPDQTKQSLQ